MVQHALAFTYGAAGYRPVFGHAYSTITPVLDRTGPCNAHVLNFWLHVTSTQPPRTALRWGMQLVENRN
jgi:hypothetical protein